MTEISAKKAGNIIIESRQKITAGGIKDVESFSPEKIVLLTEGDILSVTGRNMKIKSLSTETGDIFIEGEIDGCLYTRGKGERENFLKRVLK